MLYLLPILFFWLLVIASLCKVSGDSERRAESMRWTLVKGKV